MTILHVRPSVVTGNRSECGEQPDGLVQGGFQNVLPAVAVGSVETCVHVVPLLDANCAGRNGRG